MTEYVYYVDGVNHTEETESKVHKIMMHRDGYMRGVDSELAVIQNTPAAMNVVAGSGEAWLNGILYENTAAKTVTIEAADATYNRIDTVVVQLTWATDECITTVHKGTAAASPSAPALTQTTAVWEFPLADILVAAGATSILTADITDRRVDLYGTTIQYVIDGGGAVISAASKGYIQIPFGCTLVGWAILAAPSGSIVIDVKKCTYAGFPTTASVTAAAKPTLTTAQKGASTTLTGWTTAISQDDILEYVVDSCTTITRATLILIVTR
jgi:hypothetical protein